MDFETYYAEKKSKKPSLSEKQARAWYDQSAFANAQHKSEDDFEEADPESVKWFEKEYPGLRYFRNGAIGRMEDFRLLKDEDSYHNLRNKLIRPLKNDRVWDWDGVQQPLIKAGEVPPPRFATTWKLGVSGTINRVTRRSCEAGLRGLPCDHPVGSSECNGGVNVIRRIGE